jgi:TolA-binding protein
MLFGKKIKKDILLLLPLFFLAGCGIWTNFTAYFNLYYNTSRLFDQAESEVQAQRTDLFSTTVPPLTTATDQKLQKVIEKCSNILQFKSDSKYVDDALMMLGKAFYYQQNYLKSEHELLELLATQTDSDLRLEAQLWLGKCQMRLTDNTAGLQTLADVKKTAADNKNDDILQSVLIEEIKYKIASNDYPGAIQSSQDFLKVSGDNDLNAKVAFELGKLYELVNDEESAAKAYGSVSDYSPSYDLAFMSKIAYGVALRKAGHLNEAYSIFDDMSSQDKYKDVFDQVNFQKGVTLSALGKYPEALNVLINVDTTYKNTQYAGVSRYEIGKLYEYNFNNFDSAYAYYLKAKSTMIPTEYITPLYKTAEKFRKYNELKDDLKLSRTQLDYILSPDEFIKDSIAYSQQLDSIQQFSKQLQNNSQTGQLNQDLNNTRRTFDPNSIQSSQLIRSLQVAKLKPPERPTISADSIRDKIVYYEYELGNLFYSDFNLLDSAYYYYTDILKNYPDSDYKPKILFVLGNYYLAVSDTNRADSLFSYIYDNYKNDLLVNAAATILNKPLINFDTDPAKDLYARAEAEFNKRNYYSSITQFKDIYNNYPNSISAPKALYAEGWIFENVFNKPDSAVIFYDSLKAKYPNSEYAENISPKLEFYHNVKLKVKKAIEDSLKALQKSKEQSLSSDSSKTLKNDATRELKPGVNDEMIIAPPLIKTVNDSLKEKNQIQRLDSLIMEKRKLELKDGIPLKDTLNIKNNRIAEDSSRVKN